MFFAHLLLDDGTASAIDYGGSHSETAAARIALRLANTEQRNTCVVHKGDITQRITYRPTSNTAVTETAPPPSRYLSAVLLSDPNAAAFVEAWTGRGFVVTISASRDSRYNLVAHT